MKKSRAAIRALAAAIVISAAFAGSFVFAGQATAIWDPNLEPDLAGYRLYYWTASQPSPTVIPTSSTSVTVTNLAPGVVYSFKVTAVNLGGFQSAPSNVVTFTLPTPTPSPPLPSPTPTPTATPTPPQTPTPASTPTSTPTPTPVGISGTVFICGNPLPGVTLTLDGSWSSYTVSDANGNYAFFPLSPGGSYTVSPSKTPLFPGSGQINTVDVIAVQRHVLGVMLPPGCRLSAADVTGDGRIDTVDVVAIQRFVIGSTTGTDNVGRYQFNPTNRSYTGLVSDQTLQDYDTILFGDCAGTQPRGLAPIFSF